MSTDSARSRRFLVGVGLLSGAIILGITKLIVEMFAREYAGTVADDEPSETVREESNTVDSRSDEPSTDKRAKRRTDSADASRS